MMTSESGRENVAYLVEKLRTSSVPYHMHAGLIAHIVDHRPVGGFLTAVLSNNLKEAVARADDTNRAMLPAFVDFLYNHAPVGCWGSPEKVREWLMQDVEQVRR